MFDVLRQLQRTQMVQHAMSMRTKLLAGIVVLLMSIGTAHAYKEEPFSLMNPNGIARSRHAGEWICSMNMKVVVHEGKQQLDTQITCVDKRGKVTAKLDSYLLITPKANSPCRDKKTYIDAVERVDRNAYLVHTTDCKA
jgi:hypothetical protein